MSELTSMMNIGKEMENKLISVGIESSERLIEVGAKDAFLKIKQKYPNVCLVHLYALEGAIHDTVKKRWQCGSSQCEAYCHIFLIK